MRDPTVHLAPNNGSVFFVGLRMTRWRVETCSPDIYKPRYTNKFVVLDDTFITPFYFAKDFGMENIKFNITKNYKKNLSHANNVLYKHYKLLNYCAESIKAKYKKPISFSLIFKCVDLQHYILCFIIKIWIIIIIFQQKHTQPLLVIFVSTQFTATYQ
jgi:hypothetical protein